MKITKAIDPRLGLHRNLNLREAYNVYEKDYPLFLPDISATLAMDSPLYHRTDETLTLQSLNKRGYEADEAQLRAAAMVGGVPLEQMRQPFRIAPESQVPSPPQGRMPSPSPAPPPPTPPTVAGGSLNRAATQADTAGDAQSRAYHAIMAQAQQEEERNRATAASAADLLQGRQTPAQIMILNLNAAAAAHAASQSHPGTPNGQE